jgi:hypothetical protein
MCIAAPAATTDGGPTLPCFKSSRLRMLVARPVMKTFAVLAVGLALLCAVSAQDVIITVYAGPNCTGALATNPQPNPDIKKVGVCIPVSNGGSTTGSKIISCDGKTFTVRLFLNDDSKNTSSCLRPNPQAKDQVVTLNFCFETESSSGMYTSTCKTTPGATVASGSGSTTVGFLAFSLFLSSLVAALIL